jgi:hypothetical protein
MSFYGYQINWTIDERPHDVAVLYKYDNGGYEKALDETIDDLTRRRLPPDRILIVCPKGLEAGIIEEFSVVSEATKQRLRAVTHVVVAGFDHLGKISQGSEIQLNEARKDWTLSDKDIAMVVEQGMKEIITSTGTRMEAPPGYMFRKPSENSNRVFIRAGNMVREPAALAVIFHAMTRRLPIGAKRFYIDSFTILSIALNYQISMAKLAKVCGVEFDVPTITNFHSYSMDPRLTFEGTDDYIILISATSSGGLVEKLVTERHARRDKSFHLLAFSSNEGLQKSSVYFHKEKEGSGQDDSGMFRKVISIPGEEFLASHGETRTVDLTVSHLVSSERKIYKDPFYQDVLCLNLGESGGYGGAYRPIKLKNSEQLGSQDFVKWIDKQAHVELPRSIKLIVSAEGMRSSRLAEHIAKTINVSLSKPILCVSSADLENQLSEQVDLDSGTVLVVASDEAAGEGLLSISQMLREKPKLHRHFLIGHLFPVSARQFRRLRSNLQTSGSSTKYGWSVYSTTPVGDAALHQTWLQERSFDYSSIRLQRKFSHLKKAMILRQRTLQQLSLAGNSLFLPKIDGNHLELRHDSVLFEEKYGKISHVAIYVQVAAALQRARDRQLVDDKTILPEALCFESNPFIDTVIDPDTFSRFNDGVIQAAILRAASHAELNYSRDEKLSRHMLTIFSGIIQSRDRPRGEAVLEFMLAAFFKKLRFDKDHFVELERLIRCEAELEAIWDSFSTNPPF